MSNTNDERGMVIRSPLDGEKPLFRLMWFSGREAISRLFRYHLDVTVPHAKNKHVRFDELLGQPICVSMPLLDDSTRFFHGICASMARCGSNDHTTSYRMEMVPKMWLLTRNRNCRVFQQKSVPRIIKEVLSSFHIDFEPLKSASDYHPRDYCVQYNESDADFINRLMEEEGIYFFFRQTETGHKLVLMDSSAHAPPIPAPTKINYGGDTQVSHNENRISTWHKQQTLTASKRSLRDYTMHKPKYWWEVERPVVDSVSAGQVEHKLRVAPNQDLEIYNFPGEYAQRFDGVNHTSGDRDRTANVRADEEALSSLHIQGKSNCRHMASGHTYTVVDLLQLHQADGEYVLTSIEHEARPQILKKGKPIGVDYHNSFSCLPIGLRIRPPRVTPKPTVHGVQTARVVGPQSGGPDNPEEIHVDEFGRVKVKFHWDRSDYTDERSSAWIRVGQVWASGGFGAHFWPRVDDEVIVAFEHGDPDCPIIVGSVYNNDNRPPYDLPADKTKSGIKTKSVKSGDVRKHYNELRFDDKKGHEQIYLHAENNFDTVVETNATRRIGNKLETHVVDEEKRDIGRYRLTEIGNDGCGIDYLRDETKIHGSRWAEIATQDAIKADVIHFVADTENRIESNKDVLLEALGSIQLKVGSNSIRIDQFGVWIDAINVGIKGQLLATMHAPISSVTADGATTVNAPLTNILSTGPLVLKGAVAGMTF